MSETSTRCERHQFERAHDTCGRCGEAFCEECLVYPFGDRRPPFCIPCAVVYAGVRRSRRRSRSAA